MRFRVPVHQQKQRILSPRGAERQRGFIAHLNIGGVQIPADELRADLGFQLDERVENVTHYQRPDIAMPRLQTK